LTAVELLGIEP